MIELTYVQLIGICLGVCALSVAVMLIEFRTKVQSLSRALSAKELDIEKLQDKLADCLKENGGK
ncbi:MAG: hypothetical protein ACRCVX_02225 [Shewanella sp.]